MLGILAVSAWGKVCGEGKMGSWKALLLVTVAVLLGSAAPAQSRLALQNLTIPVAWGERTARMFEDHPDPIFLNLTTSWIPGESKRGSLRFRIPR
jgi:hypothetical protein